LRALESLSWVVFACGVWLADFIVVWTQRVFMAERV
jgi:hypothetical protein